MVSFKSLYGATAMNLFILLPLFTEFILHDWSFSFSQLAYFLCPFISIMVLYKIIQSEVLYTFHGAINFLIQMVIGGISISISINQFI